MCTNQAYVFNLLSRPNLPKNVTFYGKKSPLFSPNLSVKNCSFSSEAKVMLERISNQKLPTPKRRKVDDDENGGDDFEKIFQLYKK